jgi:hypothetical protein
MQQNRPAERRRSEIAFAITDGLSPHPTNTDKLPPSSVVTMKRPLVIYLDSQDFSRFGDVLRDKSDIQHEELFRRLEAMKFAGDIVFPATLPLMCELLQFDAAHRETTFCKAKAVERLCDSYALPAPTRLAAIEVARVAHRAGLIDHPPAAPMLSTDRLWFPTIADSLSDLRETMQTAAMQSLAEKGYEPEFRRHVEEGLAKVDWSAAVADLAPAIADQVGVPLASVFDFVVPFLRGELSSREASRGMLSGISKPTVFVDLYFERHGPLGDLPSWIRNAGLTIARYLDAVRSNLGPLRTAADKKRASLLVGRLKSSFRAISFELAKAGATEFYLDDQIIGHVAANEDMHSLVPSAHIATAAMEAYTLQVVGLTTGGAKIERSFGGDVLHSFYLPYVDLWRGDRRFSAALRQALPPYRDRIAGPLARLPEEIEVRLGQTGG